MLKLAGEVLVDEQYVHYFIRKCSRARIYSLSFARLFGCQRPYINIVLSLVGVTSASRRLGLHTMPAGQTRKGQDLQYACPAPCLVNYYFIILHSIHSSKINENFHQINFRTTDSGFDIMLYQINKFDQLFALQVLLDLF